MSNYSLVVGMGETSADSAVRVRVLSLTRFCLDFPDNPLRCLSAFRILEKSCPLFLRPNKDETELSGLSLSLSADIWYG